MLPLEDGNEVGAGFLLAKPYYVPVRAVEDFQGRDLDRRMCVMPAEHTKAVTSR